MNRQFNLIAVFLLSLAASVGAARAEQLVPPEHHPWGRFKVGAWKQVRVITETLDANGKVTATSKTETRSTLAELDDTGYTLEIASAVELAGKRFASQPQYVRQGFNGESAGQKLVSFKNLGPGTSKVNGRELTSDLRQLVLNGGDQRRTITVHYCKTVAPYVLRRETSTTDSAGETTLSQSLAEVLAVDMPLKILGEMKKVSHIKTIHTQPAGKTITLETHCLDIPGTVVSNTTKELDESGNVVRHSTLELLAFGQEDVRSETQNVRRRLFHRRTRVK